MMSLEQATINKPIYYSGNGRIKIKIRLLLNYILCWAYLINAIFIPYDNFGIKKLSFVLFILLNIDKIIKAMKSGRETGVVILFGIILPIYTIVMSIVMNGDVMGNILYGYTGMILIMYFVLKADKIDFVAIMLKVLLLLAVFINISAFLDLIGIMPIFRNPVLMWMYETMNANIGKSSIYLLGYYLFIKTSPMMLLSIGYYAWKKKYILCVVVLLALALSGTRANAVLAVITFGIAIIISEKNKTKRLFVIFAMISVILYILVGRGFLLKYVLYSVEKNGGDVIRSSTLSSIFSSWKKNPLSIFGGQGYASAFYNFGRSEYTSDVELSYWNLLRRVGLFSFIAMMIGYIYPLWHLIKKKKALPVCLGYIAYLIGCYVNPLLYTSTGVTALLFVYIVAFCINDEIDIG